MEPLSDFDFYLKFAKPLILNLPKINDRTLAAAWVRKLVDEQSDEIKLDYIKLLLFVLQRQKLVQPFNKHPNETETLEAFPEGHDLVKVAKAILEKDRAEKIKQKKECQSGDYPPYICDFSANLLEYTAVQNIENFGIHGYYAISKLPLPQWYRVDTKVLPKAAKSMIEVSPQPPTVTGTISSPQLQRDGSPEKARSPPEVSFAPPPPVEKPPADEEPPAPPEEDLDETLQPPPPPPKPETPEPFTLPKKKPKPPQSPSRLLGKPPEKDDREPPSWGSNLLEIKGFVKDEYTKDDLDLIWTSAASLPYQTPPRPGAHSDLWTSAASLPYQTPPLRRPPSPPRTPQMGGELATSTPGMGFDDDIDLWASGLGSPFDGSSAFEDSPPSFLETSVAAEDATPIKPEAYSLPYATPRIPGVTPPPPGKPTPPPRRALRAPSTKSKVAKPPSKGVKSAIPAGAVQLDVQAHTPKAAAGSAGPSKLRRFAPQKKAKKATAKAPTPPASSEYDLEELAKLGLTEADMQDINLDDIDIDLADISEPSSYDDSYEPSAKDTSIDKHLDEYTKMITELEAEYADDIAQFGGSPSVTLTTAPVASPDKSRSPRARSPSPSALARAKAATPPIPAAHDSPVRLDQSLHISPEAKRILGESAETAVQLQVVQAPPKRRALQAPKKVSARPPSPQPSTSAAAIAAEQAEAAAAAAAAPRRSRLVPPGSVAKRPPPPSSPKPKSPAAASAAESALASGIGASKAGSKLVPPKSGLLQPKRSGLKRPSSSKRAAAAVPETQPAAPAQPESEYDLKELEELGLTEADLVDINLDDLDIDLADVDLSDDDEEPSPSDEEPDERDKSIEKHLDEYSKMIAQLEEEYADDIAEFGGMDLPAGQISPFDFETATSPTTKSQSPTAALLRAKAKTPPIPQEHDAGVDLDQSLHISPAAREILSESVQIKSPPKAPPRRQLPRRSGLQTPRTREQIYKELVSEEKQGQEPKPLKAKKSKSKIAGLVNAFNKLSETSMKLGETSVSEQRDATDMAEVQLRKDLAVVGVDPLGPIQQLQADAGSTSAATPRTPQRTPRTPQSERYLSPPKGQSQAYARRVQELMEYDPERETAALQRLSEIYEKSGNQRLRSPPVFSKDADIRELAKDLRYRPDETFVDPDEEWTSAQDFFSQNQRYSPRGAASHRMEFREGATPPVVTPSPKKSPAADIIDIEELGILPEDLITEAMSPAQDVNDYMEIIAFTENFTKESPAMAGVPCTSPKHTPSPKRPKNTAALLDFSPPDFADDLSPAASSPSLSFASLPKSPRATSPQRLPSPFLTPGRATSPGGYTPTQPKSRTPSPRPSPFLTPGRASSPGGYTPAQARSRSPSPRASPFLTPGRASSPGGYTPPLTTPKRTQSPQRPPSPPPFDANAEPFEDMFIFGDDLTETSPIGIDEDLPDIEDDPGEAFTWEYDSPGIEYSSQRPVEHTFADQEGEISPPRVFWRDRADEIKSKLFGTPEQQTPTIFDLPVDRMAGETPPIFAPVEYIQDSPDIDTEALKAELRETPMAPYKRPAGARIQMPRKLSPKSKLGGIQEKVEGLDEDEYNRIMKAKGIKSRRPMRLKVGQKTLPIERHSKAPDLAMIEEFHDIDYPSSSGYEDIFSAPFQEINMDLMGVDLPDELVAQPISPLVSPEIDRKAFYKDIRKRKKEPYKWPYRAQVSQKHFVDRRSPIPQERPIAEFPEYLSEEDQQFVQDVEEAPYVYGRPETSVVVGGKHKLVEGRRKPKLDTLYEQVDYPDTPRGRATPLPKVRARRKAVPRDRLRTRRIDFDARNEYEDDYPNAVKLEAVSGDEDDDEETQPKTPAARRRTGLPQRPGLRPPSAASSSRQPQPSTSGLRRPASGLRPPSSGQQPQPSTSGLRPPGASSGLRPPSSSSQPRKIAVKKKLDKRCVEQAAPGSSNEERVQTENLEVYIEDSPPAPAIYGSSGRRRLFDDAFANIALVGSPPSPTAGPQFRTPALRILEEEQLPEGYYSPEFTPPTPQSRAEALQAFSEDVKAHKVKKLRRYPYPKDKLTVSPKVPGRGVPRGPKKNLEQKYKDYYAQREGQPFLGNVDEVPMEERAAEIHDELEDQLEEEERRRQSLLDTSIPGGQKTPMQPETEAMYRTPPHLRREVVIQPRFPTPKDPLMQMQPSEDRDILTFTDFDFPEEPGDSPDLPDDDLPADSPELATGYDYFDKRTGTTPEYADVIEKYAQDSSGGDLFGAEEFPEYESPTGPSPIKFEDIQHDYEGDFDLGAEGFDFPVSPGSPPAAQLVATKSPSPRAPSPAKPMTSRAPSPRKPSPKTPAAAASLTVETPKAPARRPARRLMQPGTMAKGRGIKPPAAPKTPAARPKTPTPAARPKTPSPARPKTPPAPPLLYSPSKPPTPPEDAFLMNQLMDEEMDLFDDDIFNDDIDENDIQIEYKERVIDSNALPPPQQKSPEGGGTDIDTEGLQELGITSELVHNILQAEQRMNQEMVESPDHSMEMYETLKQTPTSMTRKPIILKQKIEVPRGMRHKHSLLGAIKETNEDVTQFASDWESLKNKSPRSRAAYFAPDIQVTPPTRRSPQQQQQQEEVEWEYKAPPSPPRETFPFPQSWDSYSEIAEDAAQFSPPEKAKSPLSFMYGAGSAFGDEDDLFGDAAAGVLDRPPTPKTPEIFKAQEQLDFSPPTPPEEYVDIFENVPAVSIDVFGGDVPEEIYPSPVAPGVTSPTLLAADLSGHQRYLPQYGPSPGGYVDPRISVRRSRSPRVGQLPEYLEPKPMPRTPSPRSMKKQVQSHGMAAYKKSRKPKFQPELPGQTEEVLTPPNVKQLFGYNADDYTLEESPPAYFSPPTPPGMDVVEDDLELCSPPFSGSPQMSPVPSPEAESWWQQKVASPPMPIQPIQLLTTPLQSDAVEVPFAAALEDYTMPKSPSAFEYSGQPPSPFLQAQTPPPRPAYGPSPAPSPYYQAQTPPPRRAFGPSPAPSPYYQAQTPPPRGPYGPSPAPSPYYQAQTPPPRRASTPKHVVCPAYTSPQRVAGPSPAPSPYYQAQTPPPRRQASSPSDVEDITKAIEGLKVLLTDFKESSPRMKTPSPVKFGGSPAAGGIGSPPIYTSPPQYISPTASSPNVAGIIDVDSATHLVVEKTPEGFGAGYEDTSPIPEMDYSGDDQMDFKWMD